MIFFHKNTYLTPRVITLKPEILSPQTSLQGSTFWPLEVMVVSHLEWSSLSHTCGVWLTLSVTFGELISEPLYLGGLYLLGTSGSLPSGASKTGLLSIPNSEHSWRKIFQGLQSQTQGPGS